MLKDQTILVLLYLLVLPIKGNAQEIPIFKVSDFDLNGPVKSCLVSTAYGQEKYVFNEDGLLTESVTRYNDADYDVTLYKYQSGALLEKRVEYYRDGLMDRTTSIAHIYTIDTVGNRKIKEKVITYENEVLEQNQYLYGTDGKLSKIIHTSTEGIDETDLIYHQKKDADSIRFIHNDEIQKTIQTSIQKLSDTTQIKTITTVKFLEEKPNGQTKELWAKDGKLLSKTEYVYDEGAKKFVVTAAVQNAYNSEGILEKTEIKQGKTVTTKEYLYQFDATGNWIKEIITPDNTYKTRKITYYETKMAE